MPTLAEMEEENERLRRRVADLEQSAQQAGEELLRRILEAVPGGVVHVSPGGEVVLANAQAQRFLGLSYDALTRRYIQDFEGGTYKDDGSPCPVEDYPVARCLGTGQPQPPMTIGVRQPGGEIHWAVFTAIPLLFGERCGAVVTFVDITARKEAEEEARRLHERLQRTDRLASLGTLAAGIAHEINNPLTFILGNLQRALGELGAARPGGEPLAVLLAQALDGAERISRIVKEFRQFSRSEPGPAAAAPVDLRAAIDVALTLTGAEIRHRAVLVREEEPLPPARGDEGKLVQILVNLLLNAAQAIPPGRPQDRRVAVIARRVGDQAEIRVEDTGFGMDAETLKRAFDPFFTTRPVGEGTGLGLAICHHLARQMGGHVELESAVGVGTTARLLLPLAPADARPAPAAAPAPEAAPAAGARKPRILVIEDEPIIRQMLEWVLEDMDISTAETGTIGLERCLAEDFDVILCDLMMPGITGMDVYTALAFQRPGLEERMVMMTGGAFTAQAGEFLRRIANPRLAKPFNTQQVRQVILSVAEGRSVRDPG